jgi:signal transduction histidine kinase
MFIIALAFIILGTLTTMLIGLGFFSAKLLKYDLMITGSFIEVLIFLFAIIYKMFQQEKNRRSLLLKEAKMQEDLLQAYLTGSKKSSRKIVNELNIDVINKLENIKKGILTKNTDELKENISEVYNDIRRISHQLSPQALKIKGLKQSLISLVSENKQKSNIDISIGFLDFIDIFDKRGLYIIRVMQEALENAIKHSKCTDITIEIIGHEDETVYTIDDNGIGFDISKLDYKNGLLNMQTRIEVIGGFFEISSSPNNGTNIFFSIPLDYEETEQD